MMMVAAALALVGCGGSGQGQPEALTTGSSGTVDDGITTGDEAADAGHTTSPTVGVAVPGEGYSTDETDDGQDEADPASPPGQELDPPQVAEGTDSALVETPEPITDAARAMVTDFAVAYLSYDYRETDADRVERLRPLASEDLLVLLAEPMPLALTEDLKRDQRVVTAEPLEVVVVTTDVYQAVFELTTTSAGGDPATEQRLLTVVLGPDGLVHDVR
jgi:hypothetical protein